MTENKEENTTESQYPTIELVDFLENSPPYHLVIVSDLWEEDGSSFSLNKPEINLLCEHDSCQGMRIFEYYEKTGGLYNANKQNELFVIYKCKNCEETTKSFSILTLQLFSNGKGLVVKLGEWPPFGPKTPTRLLRLLGTNKDLFLRGRRAECYGLGIGAFTYYRRVVENLKNSLFDEIIKVVKKVETSPKTTIENLTNAKDNFRFTESIGQIKLAIPQVLLIDGQNPLLLLHSALSSGIHDKSDDECLELAKSIRLVLSGLAERLSQALFQKKELSEAVSKLIKVHAEKSKSKSNNKKISP